MKHTDIKLRELKTYEDCDAAITNIEMDFRNSCGTLAQWNSGHVTTLKTSAEKKIEKIRAKMDTFFSDEDEFSDWR